MSPSSPSQIINITKFIALLLSGLWPFRPHSTLPRLAALRIPAILLPCLSPVPTRKNVSLLAPTAPCEPAPKHRRKSDSSCGTKPFVGQRLQRCFLSCTDERAV